MSPKTPGTPDASNTASNYVFGSAFAGETFSTIGYTANSPNVFNVNPGRVPNLDLNDLLKIPALEFSARDDSKTDDPDATFDEDGGSDQGDTNVRSVRNAVTSDVSG